jgi:hypothetical protein
LNFSTSAYDCMGVQTSPSSFHSNLSSVSSLSPSSDIMHTYPTHKPRILTNSYASPVTCIAYLDETIHGLEVCVCQSCHHMQCCQGATDHKYRNKAIRCMDLACKFKLSVTVPCRYEVVLIERCVGRKRGNVKVLVCECYSLSDLLWVSYKHKNCLRTWVRRETLATYVLWPIRHSVRLG